MMVHIPSRLAFLATPKCASTSIENALRPHCHLIATGFPSMTHMHVNRFNRFMRPFLRATGFPNVKTCCLFREPIDWVGSWWRYRSQDRWGDSEALEGMSFEDYVGLYISGEKRPFLPHGPQSGMFWGPEGRRVYADYIFKYEDLDLFRQFWESKLGVKLAIGKDNVSPGLHSQLSPEMRSKLSEFIAADFEIWEHKTIQRDGFDAFLREEGVLDPAEG
ncbi:MAG: hypothetical protein AAGI50_19825 [Pseudomonadota bacterium]